MTLSDIQLLGIAIALGSLIPGGYAYYLQKDDTRNKPIVFPNDAQENRAITDLRKSKMKRLTLKWRMLIVINVLMVVFGSFVSGGLMITTLVFFVYILPLIMYARNPFHDSSSDSLYRIEKYLEKVAEMNKNNPERIKKAIQKVSTDYELSTSDYNKLLLHLSKRSDIIGNVAKELHDSFTLS